MQKCLLWMKCYLCLTCFLVAVCGAWAYSESPPQRQCDHKWTKRVLIFKTEMFANSRHVSCPLVILELSFLHPPSVFNVPWSGERVLPSSDCFYTWLDGIMEQCNFMCAVIRVRNRLCFTKDGVYPAKES